MGCFLAMLVYFAVLAVSWAVTCVFVKLISICFSITFSLAAATGIWLVLVLVSSFLPKK